MFIKKLKYLATIFSAVLFFSATSNAQIEFLQMSQQDVDLLVQDLSSAFGHTSISPASSLGSIFGVEISGYGGTTTADGLTKLVQAEDSTKSEIILPHVGVLLAVSVPMGVTFELNSLPSFDADGAAFNANSMGVKWTMTQGLFELPFDLALKVSQSTLDMSVTQTVTGATGKYEISTKNLGIMLMASKSFVIVEPYVGVGTASLSGDVNFTAAVADSGFSFPGTSADASKSGTQLVAGVQLNLLFFKLGFETGKVLDATRSSFKLGFKF